MMTIARLGSVPASARVQVGEKAWSLDRLVRSGFSVPAGVVVPAPMLWELIRDAGIDQEVRQRLRPGINNAGVISSKLAAVSLDRVLDLVREEIRGFAGPFAVRSSSRLEDRADRSFAGLFTSVLGVGREDLPGALRAVWLSGYSALVLALAGDVPPDHMAVIVQEQVEARAAGVCFSRDPRQPGAGNMLAEAVDGTAEALLAGDVVGARYEIPRGGGPIPFPQPPSGALTAGDLLQLRDHVAKVEELLGCPADVEFAFGPYSPLPLILQARPISRLPSERAVSGCRRSPSGADYADIDDLQAAADMADGALTELVSKRTTKRHYFRTVAHQHGVTVSTEWLVVLPSVQGVQVSPGQAIAETVRALTRAEVIEIALASGRKSMVTRGNLDAALEQVRVREPVFAGEVLVGALSGFAAIQPDGSMIIEYVPGAAGGLMYGSGPFSVLIVDEHGNRLVDETRPALSHWRFDHSAGRFCRVDEPCTPEPLGADDVVDIRKIASAMQTAFGEIRLEWLRTDDGRIVLWDLSLESGQPLPARTDGVVSSGTARGPAIIIPDTSRLEKVLADRSVLPDAGFQAAYSSAAASDLRDQILGGWSGDPAVKPIVVAPFPRVTLALLLGHVSGFVFDEAATLSHLAIILREAGVPAVISPNASGVIKQGQFIEIADGGWHPGSST